MQPRLKDIYLDEYKDNKPFEILDRQETENEIHLTVKPMEFSVMDTRLIHNAFTQRMYLKKEAEIEGLLAWRGFILLGWRFTGDDAGLFYDNVYAYFMPEMGTRKLERIFLKKYWYWVNKGDPIHEHKDTLYRWKSAKTISRAQALQEIEADGNNYYEYYKPCAPLWLLGKEDRRELYLRGKAWDEVSVNLVTLEKAIAGKKRT